MNFWDADCWNLHIIAISLESKNLEASNCKQAAEVTPAIKKLLWHAKVECER